MNITTDVNAKVDQNSIIMAGIVVAIVASFIVLLSKIAKHG